jgi:hypothetical protein
MSLYFRYKGHGGGVRLDNKEDPQAGRALDLGQTGGGIEGPYKLWVRDAQGRQAQLDRLTPGDLANLRDGISAMLAYDGHEEVTEVNVPMPVEARR